MAWRVISTLIDARNWRLRAEQKHDPHTPVGKAVDYDDYDVEISHHKFFFFFIVWFLFPFFFPLILQKQYVITL